MFEILELIFSSFWKWLGFVIMAGPLMKFLYDCWDCLLRNLNVRKHGWPPAHVEIVERE